MVGLGTRGKKWARILHEETKSQTVGYVDIDDANLEWAQTMYEAKPETCYNDMSQALKDLQPDFVVLATPPMDRYETRDEGLRKRLPTFFRRSHFPSISMKVSAW